MPSLEHIYSRRVEQKPKDRIQEINEEKGSKTSKDIILLEKSDGKELARVLHTPELAAEVERAVEQVEKNNSPE